MPSVLLFIHPNHHQDHHQDHFQDHHHYFNFHYFSKKFSPRFFTLDHPHYLVLSNFKIFNFLNLNLFHQNVCYLLNLHDFKY